MAAHEALPEPPVVGNAKMEQLVRDYVVLERCIKLRYPRVEGQAARA